MREGLGKARVPQESIAEAARGVSSSRGQRCLLHREVKRTVRIKEYVVSDL